MKVERPRARLSAGADAGENAIDQSQPRRTRRNERSHLRHQRDQRRLTQVGRLASHVRAGDNQHRVGCPVQVKIVGYEAIGDAAHVLLLDHRMTPVNNLNVSALDELRTAIVAIGCKCRERRQYIDFRQRQRGLPNAPCLGGNRHPQLSKQPPLDLDHLLLRVQHLRLYSFSSGVVKRSALTSVCLRS